ncbi:DUF5000 domain-containing lipoprotein [Paraflavitalea sp. CAU 1676]|uniref:DUF5000 domain-containing lipoprotein n=1 Tax=Paraflavitalea sp. CAU 1676 TaxID=3032598 RepID=UPI0023DCAE38|nr:DUF5000 domain-containing lipoprotein [Paraflavitalea sp. CAU 1676]MDF2188826.1 DUF5000 domain-containing lipoprotein [Paraflavitalea sp. CAU 1676]
MKRIPLSYALPLLLLAAACKKSAHQSLYGEGVVPAAVTSTAVKNLPGAAEITYSLPHDNSILYVKAEYERQPGNKQEMKASYYANKLTVDGFGDTLEHAVKLYVVNRSEQVSEPVTVKVKPLTAPVTLVYRSLAVGEDFGGLRISFGNESKADVAIYVLTPDDKGLMAQAYVQYTTLEAGTFTLRGYDSAARKFSFYVRDRYGNVSDTMTKTYKPLYEKALDKKLFKKVQLPTDIGDDWGLPMENLWNGSYLGFWDMFHTQTKPFPMWFTFDMGIKVKLSRLTMWQRQSPVNDWAYNANNPKKFEIWGSNTPDTDGGWSNWTKLVEHTVVKPSGLPLGQLSADDIAAVAKGEEMTVGLDKEPVRYLRIKVIETFTMSATNIAELSIWGQP